MGRVAGDKSRFHRERRKRIARREQMRALRATWLEEKSGKPAEKDAGAEQT